MASPQTTHQEPSQTPQLQYQTWILRVSIHCQGCKRKVKKVLQNLEGVYTTDIDSRQQKVAVTGNIDSQTLIKKLVKNGKHAELWPEKPAGRGQREKPGKNDKGDNSKSCGNSEEEDEENNSPPDNNNPAQVKVNSPGVNNSGSSVKFIGVDPSTMENRPPVIFARGENSPAPEKTATSGSGGQKKKKGRKGSKNKSKSKEGPEPNGAPKSAGFETLKVGSTQAAEPVNLSPPQSVYHYAPQQEYLVSYCSVAHPTASGPPDYYSMFPPYDGAAYDHLHDYQAEGEPLNSFQILSDENPNGCLIM